MKCNFISKNWICTRNKNKQEIKVHEENNLQYSNF